MLTNPALMCIGNKKLTISGATNSFQQMIHSICVQFLKNIIHENDGCKTFVDFQHFIFCKFHSKKKAFALTL